MGLNPPSIVMHAGEKNVTEDIFFASFLKICLMTIHTAYYHARSAMLPFFPNGLAVKKVNKNGQSPYYGGRNTS